MKKNFRFFYIVFESNKLDGDLKFGFQVISMRNEHVFNN